MTTFNSVILRYEKMNICHEKAIDQFSFQMGYLQDAANAAFTVLQKQPDHKIMLENLKYYMKSADIQEDDLQDLEAKVFFLL